MKRVGIITYHSAYNFGSVLQAMATQISIEKLGYEAGIINYRMKSQRAFYSFFRTNYGYKTMVKDLMLIPFSKQRRKHDLRFENVISELKLTSEYVEPNDVKACDDMFDCFISGSDQIWNKRSCELTPVGWEYMDPYLLKFTNKKKISYASSVASMTDEELDRILPSIDAFDALSFRERISAEKVGKMLNKEIETVLDPTLLLSEDDWNRIFDLSGGDEFGKYILYYSLAGYQDVKDYLAKLADLAKSNNLKVIAITPFLAFKDTEYIHHVYDSGPVEFLKYIRNAELIVTDSYHGTLFSINFNRPFYSITDGSASHMRKNQILEELGLTDHISANPETLQINEKVAGEDINMKIAKLREKSISYLEDSLSD